MNQIVAQLTQFFLQYSLKQRIIITSLVLVFLSTVIAFIMWANKTEYEVLFTNLNPQDASEIVTNLSNDKIKYRLENGGTTIYVQQDMVNELRIRFHNQGVDNNSPMGWEEIFDKDKTNMGETSTMQRVKIIRAKEGELMKTLNLMSWIKSSRVHLNIPERRLFEDDRRGSATAVLTLSGASESESQLQSIPALIANSVEGISPADVTVVDSRGNLLYNGEEETNMGSTGNQWELSGKVEKEIKSKVRNLVETSIGYGNSSVQVNVDLNFDQVQQTIEDIDPDDVTVLSEEIYNQAAQEDKDSSNSSSESSITNYEFSKTVRNIVHGIGNINRLSVAVAVNGTYKTVTDANGDEKREYIPRTQKELDDLTTLVRSAVGYNEQRGDVVSVINTQFADQPIYEVSFLEELKAFDLWKDILTYILVGVGLLLGFNLIKAVLNSDATSKLFLPVDVNKKSLKDGKMPEFSLTTSKNTPEEEEELSEDLYIAKLSPEARARMRANDKMTKDVIKFAQDNPEQTTGLMRAWLAERN
ncbi:MAG: flagellar M-ring protein FliF [Calditrichaeota bacterium]|nr:flagellar M-ring protein FliF [Calditrichota bacterium]